MSTLRTAGELRGFLADVLIGIQAGTIDTNRANAIAKVSAQINQSLATEVNTALQLEKMGKGRPVAGSMVIAGGDAMEVVEQLPAPPVEQGTKPKAPLNFVAPKAKHLWCEQCDLNVSVEEAAGCKSAFCKAK